MNPLLPFSFFDPVFFAGLLEDPVLLIRTRLESNIMVDCGHINHLAKRVIKSVGSLFVSHAHMDHFVGLDRFTRSVLVSNKTINLYGPPEISEKLEKKLQGYVWNLVENYYFSFQVHEVHEKCIKIFSLPGKEQFQRSLLKETPREQTIFDNAFFHVEAEICDHKIPVLIFKFTEKPIFKVDKDKIRQNGYAEGQWLAELKKWYTDPDADICTLNIPLLAADQCEPVSDLESFYQIIKKDQPTRSIGYVTDIGLTDSNREKVISLMKGVTLLFCECSFLSNNRNKARRSYHLCTDDLNYLCSKIQPEFIMPMHLSKSYLGNSDKLYEEIVLPFNCSLLKLPERIQPMPMHSDDVPLIF